MKLDSIPPTWLLGGALAAGLAFFVWRKGGVAQAAASVGGAAVDAVGGVASGAVGAVGSGFGLPTPSQTTTDPDVARWLIDTYGFLTASKWAGAGALITAAGMPEGSGRAPTEGTAVADALLPKPHQGVDEVDRLLRLHPAPVDPYAGYSDLPGYYGPAPDLPL